MIKKYYFVVAIITLGLLACAVTQAATSTINGSSQFNKQTHDSLEVNGRLTFNDLIVKDNLIANGSIEGKGLQCKVIESNGSFNVNEVKAKTVKSSGSFTAKNIEITDVSEFYGTLEIKTGKLHECQIASTFSTLIDTEVVGNIFIKKATTGWSFFGGSANESSVQVLELKGKSIINGDIIFEYKGEVHLFGEAKVRGKIINGKVIKK